MSPDGKIIYVTEISEQDPSLPNILLSVLCGKGSGPGGGGDGVNTKIPKKVYNVSYALLFAF